MYNAHSFFRTEGWFGSKLKILLSLNTINAALCTSSSLVQTKYLSEMLTLCEYIQLYANVRTFHLQAPCPCVIQVTLTYSASRSCRRLQKERNEKWEKTKTEKGNRTAIHYKKSQCWKHNKLNRNLTFKQTTSSWFIDNYTALMLLVCLKTPKH